jgi:hypothetical protein
MHLETSITHTAMTNKEAGKGRDSALMITRSGQNKLPLARIFGGPAINR